MLEPMWYALETPYEPDPRLEQATPGQRAAYALVCTESGVSNGGVPDGRAPESRVARQEALDDFSPAGKEQVGRLDDRFFALLDDPARSPARFLEAYVRRHPDEFFLPS